MNHNERMKEYRQKNPDKIKAILQRYKDKNRERFTEYNKLYAKKRYEGSEEYRQYMREKGLEHYYAKKNPYVVECKRFLKISI